MEFSWWKASGIQVKFWWRSENSSEIRAKVKWKSSGIEVKIRWRSENSSKCLVEFKWDSCADQKFKWNSSKIQGRPSGRCRLELINPCHFSHMRGMPRLEKPLRLISGEVFLLELRSHLGTPALKPRILVKKSVVLVKRKNGFTQTIPGQKTQEKKERSVWVNPFSRFTKTSDFFTKILGH